MPADVAPSRNRNALDKASSRMWKGRPGRPSGSTARSTGRPRLSAAHTARAMPHSAPSGNSVRPANSTLRGRSKPAAPIPPHARSSTRQAFRYENDTSNSDPP